MRCKACNACLDSVEMSRDLEYNGMCRRCVGMSDPKYVYTRDKEYEQESTTESISLLKINKLSEFNY